MIVLVLSSVYPTLPAATITVPGDFAKIQAAINAADTGDEIVVAVGTYAIKSTIDFLGKAVTLRSTSGNPNDTVLDGQNQVYHVIQCVSGEGIDTVLSGFTITGGNANGSPDADRYGGGMYNYQSGPTITNCTFSGNSAIWSGGGMCNYNSSPTVTNCTVSGNSAVQGGGGMYNGDSSPTVIDCTFSENTADGAGGGGMYNGNSSPTVTNCTFTGNSATRMYNATGGGMCNYISSPTVTNCTFSGNWAYGGGYYGAGVGGGMYNGDSSPTVTNCTFSGNLVFSEYGGGLGGGMYNEGYSSPTVTNCCFSGNLSVYSGGGMYNQNNSSPTVNNCIFSGNEALDGGGMTNDNSNLSVTNCTFNGNWAEDGGGILNIDSSPPLTNCILWGNSWSQIHNHNSSAPAIYYSNIQDGLPPGAIDGGGNINADPLFVDADGADNTTGTSDDDLRLQSGSPCIDAGNNSAVINAADIAGIPRFLDGNCDTTATVDMGAYEYSRRYQGDLNDDCGVNLPDLAILSVYWQSSAIEADVAAGYGDGIVDMADLLVVAENWLLEI